MSTEPEIFTAIRDLPQLGRPNLSLKTAGVLNGLLGAYRRSGIHTEPIQELIELGNFLGDDRDPARIVLAVALRRIVALEDQIEAQGEGGRLRYIVLGTIANIEFWRRQNDLCRHDVIAVTSNVNLRGLGVGRYKLVTLASWKPTPDVAADVRESLRAIEAHGAVIER